MADSGLQVHRVWDAPTRWFHWINMLSVLGLIAVGLVILYGKSLGLSNEGKILLKSVHVWIGYLFTINLLWRFIWAFLGNRYARWRAILPGGPGYGAALHAYISAFLAGHPKHYLGHNPVGRIGVTVLLILLVIQALTGLVLASTDLYWPPFGGWIANWVAAPGVAPDTLVPHAPELVDKASFDEMRSFRKPFVVVHEYASYLLLVAIVVHVAGVVITEVREEGSLVSAMITGKKVIGGRAIDEPPTQR